MHRLRDATLIALLLLAALAGGLLLYLWQRVEALDPYPLAGQVTGDRASAAGEGSIGSCTAGSATRRMCA